MKKLFVLFLTAVLLSSAVFAEDIWLTKETPGPKSESTQYFLAGERVYINFRDLPSTGYWGINISGNSDPNNGPVSCDEKVVYSGFANLASPNGSLATYRVKDDDCGMYIVNLYKVGEQSYYLNYYIGQENQIPEFGVVASLIALIGASAIFFIVRK